MQSATAQVRSSLKTSLPRLRRQPANHLAGSLRTESWARKMPDIPRLIGFGMLLVAALLVVVGAASV